MPHVLFLISHTGPAGAGPSQSSLKTVTCKLVSRTHGTGLIVASTFTTANHGLQLILSHLPRLPTQGDRCGGTGTPSLPRLTTALSPPGHQHHAPNCSLISRCNSSCSDAWSTSKFGWGQWCASEAQRLEAGRIGRHQLLPSSPCPMLLLKILCLLTQISKCQLDGQINCCNSLIARLDRRLATNWLLRVASSSLSLGGSFHLHLQ